MSTKLYSILALNRGYSKIDLSRKHNPDFARKFLKIINHSRHTYANEIEGYFEPSDLSDLIIYANETGVYAYNTDLALDMSLCGKKSNLAAESYQKLLCVAYNDQCNTDIFSYYENELLVRHVCSLDGYGPSEITFKGEMLDEEKNAIIEAKPPKYYEPDELGTFIVDGTSYTIEGHVPLSGCGIHVAKRLVDEEIESFWPTQGAIFKAKPWWKRW